LEQDIGSEGVKKERRGTKSSKRRAREDGSRTAIRKDRRGRIDWSGEGSVALSETGAYLDGHRVLAFW